MVGSRTSVSPVAGSRKTQRWRAARATKAVKRRSAGSGRSGTRALPKNRRGPIVAGSRTSHSSATVNRVQWSGFWSRTRAGGRGRSTRPSAWMASQAGVTVWGSFSRSVGICTPAGAKQMAVPSGWRRATVRRSSVRTMPPRAGAILPRSSWRMRTWPSGGWSGPRRSSTGHRAGPYRASSSKAAWRRSGSGSDSCTTRASTWAVSTAAGSSRAIDRVTASGEGGWGGGNGGSRWRACRRRATRARGGPRPGRPAAMRRTLPSSRTDSWIGLAGQSAAGRSSQWPSTNRETPPLPRRPCSQGAQARTPRASGTVRGELGMPL